MHPCAILDITKVFQRKETNKTAKVTGMEMKGNKVKIAISIGILLFLTGCTAGASTEQASGMQEEWQAQDNQQVEESSIGTDVQTGREGKKKESSEPAMNEETNPASKPDIEDDEFYVQGLQNLHQGNNIVYADGYYYFRSQTQNYSLCRTKGTGMPVEVVADQIPGAVCVRGDWVYFVNVSDSRTLYRVGTDGSGLEKLSDFSMQELIVLEDKIYFRSVYDREYDPFYQLTEEAAEDDRYLYTMNLDGTGCELVLPRVCIEFVTDGEWLYYLLYEEGKGYVLYKNSPDGQQEEQVFQKEDGIWDVLPYRGEFYWVEGEQDQLVRLNTQGKEEILAADVRRFAIARGQAYVMNEEEIRKVELVTGQESLVAKRPVILENDGQSREDTYPWYAGSYNRGIFVVNGQVFARYFESEEKGVLWHILEGEKFVVFEDMEPLAPEKLVLDSSFLYELNFYYPGRTDEHAEQYLDADNEIQYEESFGTREDGVTYGDFYVTLPRFNAKLPSCEQLNHQMEELFKLAMEDKDSFFQEMSELEQDQCIMWYRRHEYGHLYIGEDYISMHYFRTGYEGGMRDWKTSLPLIFDRETGLMLHMDDLFTVEESVYKKRLTGAIYKYCEMIGMDHWNEAFDNNVLVKNLGDLRCYLTPDGMVLCYERYEIQAGCAGSPTFEIPYEWFADIFK